MSKHFIGAGRGGKTAAYIDQLQAEIKALSEFKAQVTELNRVVSSDDKRIEALEAQLAAVLQVRDEMAQIVAAEPYVVSSRNHASYWLARLTEILEKP